ncbi:MAG: hypothetical protein ACYCXQ_02455 [Candidatus Humimicrobiaceae bacterium]
MASKDFLINLKVSKRRKLRIIIWKYSKKIRTKFRKLIDIGFIVSPKKTIGYFRKKHWRLSITPQLDKIKRRAYPRDKSLLNLVESGED